jgi:hypothetical protein
MRTITQQVNLYKYKELGDLAKSKMILGGYYAECDEYKEYKEGSERI